MESVVTQIAKAKILDETLDESDAPYKDSNVFILVNSRSGSCVGRNLIKKFDKMVSIKHQANTFTNFYIYDLYLKSDVEDCFKLVHELTENNIHARILIGGGDGTIQWVISSAVDFKIDFSRVAFGVLPIGTGNDFAGSIGWGNFQFEVNYKCLKQLANQLNSSEISSYDVWDCEVECFEEGTITEIKNGVQISLTQNKINKIFTNYFGIGSDARVTYLQQKMNAKSIFLKKFCYVVAGLRSFCRSSTKLKKKLKQFLEIGNNNIGNNNIGNNNIGNNNIGNNNNNNMNEQNQFDSTVITSKISQKESKSVLEIYPTDQCITFLNATRSMQIECIWQSPHSIRKPKIYQEQKVNDGIIQIVSYQNQLSLAFEKCFHNANKVGQGEGPFLITFQSIDLNNNEPLYIHINGEPYKIDKPKSILICKSKEISKSKIKVLFRK